MSTDRNFHDNPPTFSDLLDFAEGRLTGEDKQCVADYIAGISGKAKSDWEWVQAFLSASRSVDLHPVPTDLQEKLRGIYAIQPLASPLEAVSEWVQGVRRIVAELVEMGSSPEYAMAGLRSQSFEETTRQWVFKAEPFEVWINALVRPDQQFDLHGQLISLTENEKIQAVSAQLIHGDVEASLVSADAHGEFVISGVATGSYELVISGEDIEIVCGPVSLEK